MGSLVVALAQEGWRWLPELTVVVKFIAAIVGLVTAVLASVHGRRCRSWGRRLAVGHRRRFTRTAGAAGRAGPFAADGLSAGSAMPGDATGQDRWRAVRRPGFRGRGGHGRRRRAGRG